MARALLVFVDGVGLGGDDAEVNPIAAADLPTISRLLAGARPVRVSGPLSCAEATLVPLDANLGVPGLPQSGTGQTTLLTGRNAALRLGRHMGPWVPTALRAELMRTSVLRLAKEAGRSAAFANAYPEELIRALDATGMPRGATPLRAGPPLAALGAELLDRHTAELSRGDAIASEITNDGWIERLRRDVPRIDARTAGVNLARIAAAHDLTLYAHYNTDHAGHRGTYESCVEAIERVDAFLGGVLETLPSDVLMVVASDHGNLEDTRGGHTRNPALGLVTGVDHARAAASLGSLTDIVPLLLRRLELPPLAAAGAIGP